MSKKVPAGPESPFQSLQVRLGAVEATCGSLTSGLEALLRTMQSPSYTGKDTTEPMMLKELDARFSELASHNKKTDETIASIVEDIKKSERLINTIQGQYEGSIGNMREMLTTATAVLTKFTKDDKFVETITDIQKSLRIINDTIENMADTHKKSNKGIQQDIEDLNNRVSSQQQLLADFGKRLEQVELLYADLANLVTKSGTATVPPPSSGTPKAANEVKPVELDTVKQPLSESNWGVNSKLHNRQWFFGDYTDSTKKLTAGDPLILESTKTYGISSDQRVICVSKEGNYLVDIRGYLKHTGDSAIAELAVSVGGVENYSIVCPLSTSDGSNWAGHINSQKVIYLSAGDSLSISNKGCEIIAGSKQIPLSVHVLRLDC